MSGPHVQKHVVWGHIGAFSGQLEMIKTAVRTIRGQKPKTVVSCETSFVSKKKSKRGSEIHHGHFVQQFVFVFCDFCSEKGCFDVLWLWRSVLALAVCFLSSLGRVFQCKFVERARRVFLGGGSEFGKVF